MREIKYRAWNISCKEYIYNIEQENDGCIGPCDCFGDYLHNDNYIVEQYTGLKDKNGKEIYEGDIIRYLEYSNPIEALAKGEGQYNFAPIGWDETGGAFRCMDYYLNEFDYTEEVEIIGNIHETPELLNG